MGASDNKRSAPLPPLRVRVPALGPLLPSPSPFPPLLWATLLPRRQHTFFWRGKGNSCSVVSLFAASLPTLYSLPSLPYFSSFRSCSSFRPLTSSSSSFSPLDPPSLAHASFLPPLSSPGSPTSLSSSPSFTPLFLRATPVPWLPVSCFACTRKNPHGNSIWNKGRGGGLGVGGGVEAPGVASGRNSGSGQLEIATGHGTAPVPLHAPDLQSAPLAAAVHSPQSATTESKGKATAAGGRKVAGGPGTASLASLAAAAAESGRGTAAERGRKRAVVIDGKRIAEEIKQEVREVVERMKEETGKVPGLAVVLVGDRADSVSYVRSKQRACEEVGMASFVVALPAESTEEEVARKVLEVNDDDRVHGVLVQLPLPEHMSEERVLGLVSLEKDVDGFHPLNFGQLALQGREPLFVPCTPKGCVELLLRSGVEISGKRAVVIGRSNIVGTPVALLLLRKNATVTVVHLSTRNPEELVRQADIVVAAAGVPELVRGDWLKPGCVVVDVGINSVEDPGSVTGHRLVGDVCFEEAREVASAITPVPGGVGPMTIAMLLCNTLAAAARAHDLGSRSKGP